ncbi:hypothetical protein DIPPA_28138 [Diplonema papillatum]|nr:hypothetical protein DIPPA_28138 [Diplonema papillatum]
MAKKRDASDKYRGQTLSLADVHQLFRQVFDAYDHEQEHLLGETRDPRCLCRACVKVRENDDDLPRRSTWHRRKKDSTRQQKQDEARKREIRLQKQAAQRYEAAISVQRYWNNVAPLNRKWKAIRSGHLGGPGAARRAVVVCIDDYPIATDNFAAGAAGDLVRLFSACEFATEFWSPGSADPKRRPTRSNLLALRDDCARGAAGTLVVVVVCRSGVGALPGCVPIKRQRGAEDRSQQISPAGRLLRTFRFSTSAAQEDQDDKVRFVVPSGSGRETHDAVIPLFDLSEIVHGVATIPMGQYNRPTCSRFLFVDAWPTATFPSGFSTVASTISSTMEFDHSKSHHPSSVGLLSLLLCKALSGAAVATKESPLTGTGLLQYIYTEMTEKLGVPCTSKDAWKIVSPPDTLRHVSSRSRRKHPLSKQASVLQQALSIADAAASSATLKGAKSTRFSSFASFAEPDAAEPAAPAFPPVGGKAVGDVPWRLTASPCDVDYVPLIPAHFALWDDGAAAGGRHAQRRSNPGRGRPIMPISGLFSKKVVVTVGLSTTDPRAAGLQTTEEALEHLQLLASQHGKVTVAHLRPTREIVVTLSNPLDATLAGDPATADPLAVHGRALACVVEKVRAAFEAAECPVLHAAASATGCCVRVTLRVTDETCDRIGGRAEAFAMLAHAGFTLQQQKDEPPGAHGDRDGYKRGGTLGFAAKLRGGSAQGKKWSTDFVENRADNAKEPARSMSAPAECEAKVVDVVFTLTATILTNVNVYYHFLTATLALSRRAREGLAFESFTAVERARSRSLRLSTCSRSSVHDRSRGDAAPCYVLDRVVKNLAYLVDTPPQMLLKRDLILAFAVTSHVPDIRGKQLVAATEAAEQSPRSPRVAFFYFEPALWEKDSRNIPKGPFHSWLHLLVTATCQASSTAPQPFLCDLQKGRNYTMSTDLKARIREPLAVTVAHLLDEHAKGCLNDLIPPVKGSKVSGWGALSSKYVLLPSAEKVDFDAVTGSRAKEKGHGTYLAV